MSEGEVMPPALHTAPRQQDHRSDRRQSHFCNCTPQTNPLPPKNKSQFLTVAQTLGGLLGVPIFGWLFTVLPMPPPCTTGRMDVPMLSTCSLIVL